MDTDFARFTLRPLKNRNLAPAIGDEELIVTVECLASAWNSRRMTHHRILGAYPKSKHRQNQRPVPVLSGL